MLKISDLSLDDELKEFLPRGSDSERSELLANIQSDGRITDPLIVWLNHGIVVDGQTRFDIWQNELGADEDFPHEIIEKHFESKDQVKAWMIRHQAGRRNWNTSQRAFMAAELATLQVGSNQHFSKDWSGQYPKKEGVQKCPPSIAEAADEMSVSPRLVKTAKHVIENGSETLKAAVKNGTVRATDADKITKLPKAEQAKAVAKVAAGKASTVAKAASIDPEKARAESIMASQKTGKPSGGTTFDPTEFDAAMSEEAADATPTNVPKHLKEVAASCKEFAACVSEAGRLKGRIEKLVAGPGGGKLAKWWTDTERCLAQVQTYLKCYRFWAACPECKITDKHTKAAKDCKLCGGHGWIAETNGLSDVHKVWLRERGVKL